MSNFEIESDLVLVADSVIDFSLSMLSLSTASMVEMTIQKIQKLRHFRRCGSVLILVVCITLLKFTDGKTFCIIWSISDITDYLGI